jgi:predicted permease
MPCAINTLLVAHAYGLNLRLASGAIASSTALVLVVGLGASAV